MRRVALIQHIRKNLSTKHAIRIIFHENKFAHIQELFKKNNILNTCQLNILNNLLFLHRVKDRKVTNVLLSNISRPSHRYQANFSRNNYILPSFKRTKSKHRITLRSTKLWNNILN